MSAFIENLKKYSTSTLSDALDSLGVNGGLEGIRPRTRNTDFCGEAFTVEYGIPNEHQEKEGKAADFIDSVKSGEVIVLANNGRGDCTVWGSILTRVAINNGIEATVIDGACRDIDELDIEKYPLFSKYIYMKSGKGRTLKTNQQVDIYVGKTKISPGDFVRGDKNGVLVIPKQLVKETLERSEKIIITESKIIESVLKGAPLMEARIAFKYNRPWEEN